MPVLKRVKHKPAAATIILVNTCLTYSMWVIHPGKLINIQIFKPHNRNSKEVEEKKKLDISLHMKNLKKLDL